MKPEVVCITTRQPRDASDPGEQWTVYFIVESGTVRVTDAEGHLLRFEDGSPVRRAIHPGDNPRVLAARLGRSYHAETYGDRQRGFWRDLPPGRAPA